MKNITIVFILLLLSPLLWAKGSNDTALSDKNSELQQKGGLISAENAKKLMDQDKSVILIDVRTKAEYESGKIPGALLLPYDEISEKTASKIIPSKDETIIVYCRSGRRSSIAAKSLENLGYTIVYDLGGIGSWPYGLE